MTGVADLTGLNPGNWTVSFDPATIGVNLPQFEVYKIVVMGAPNTTFDVYIDSQQWDTGVYGALNSWDPEQPLILRPGQYLNFLYSDPVTDGFPPVITIWLRYDTGVTSVAIQNAAAQNH
jgi:hypothetical protein